MGRKRKIPKKLVVPTTPRVEEPLKIYHTPEAFYLDHLRSLCARAETPTSLVEGKSLDEHACYVRRRISKKGKILLGQIHHLQCYAWNLCYIYIYDFTCCSENPKKHLPYQCEFIDNGILSYYAKGVYSYYDVQQIEEFVAFEGAYEIASLIETYDVLFTNLKILPYLNIVTIIMLLMPMLNHILRSSPLSKKRLIFCRSLWKKKLMKL